MSNLCTKFDIALFYILIIWIIEDLKYVNTEESNLSKNSNPSIIYRPNQLQKQWKRPEIYNIQNDFTIKYDEKKPKIITKLKNMRVLRDEQAIFICVTDGNPSPIIRWFVNEQYQLPKRYTVVEISPKKSLLRLNPVKISDDNIRVTCLAKSQLGVANSYAQLMVYKGKEDTPSGFPTLVSKSSVIVNEKNTRVLLECKVKGNPKPEILWLKDSIPVDFDNPRIQFLKNGNLEINKTREDDEGAYECMATNKYGTIVSNVIRLMIRVSYFAPQFIYVSDDQIVAPGSSVTLKCRALGNPIPEVFWKCGQTILQSHSSNLTLQKTEANVILSDLSESLKCTCVAKNSKEPIFRTISITIQELSIAPTNIRISHVGPTSCNISWNQKAVREDQLKYQIFIMKTSDFQNGKNDKTGLVVNVKKSDYEFVVNKSVDNLLPFTNYTVWLESYPQQIDSIKSNFLKFTTLELPPYTPPRNVELSAISNGALVLTWISPEIPNGIITIYNIYYTQYRQTSLSLWEKYTFKVTANSESKFHTYILSHLLNNVTYYISISGQNSAGPGPVSEPQAILVRAGVVQGPKNFRAIAKSSTEIELFWDPIISKSQISVKWYYLIYMPKSVPDLLLDKKIEYSPNIKTILIDNLSPNTTYEFQLSAITESANGMSSTVECTTSVKVIEDPIKIYTKVINSTSIQVFWQTNPERNRQIDFFRIQCHRYFPDRKSQTKDFKEFYLKRSLISFDYQNTTMRHTFTQLNPDTEYQIYLNAIFRQRQGSIFKSEPVKTWPKKLPKPQDLHLRLSCQFDNPCVKIKWKEDIKNKKWIRGYQLKYYPLFESNEIKMKIIERNVTDTKFETSYLDHLQGIRYEFRVAAFSDYEIGEETISQIDILEGTPSVFPSGFKLKPTTNLNPTLVFFTWDKVSQHSLNGRFRQYEVWCFIISQGNGTSTFYTTKTESLTISNLKEDSNYACRVKVWIQKTSGSWSDPIYFKTRDAHFPPPESIRFIRLSHSTAQITWKWNPNFLLYYSHFIIYYTNEKQISNKTFWFIESTKSIFTKVILRSLNATVLYAIRVSSVSNRGIEGPLSEIVKETSLSSSSWPAKCISELSCAPVSSTTIQLRWFISFEKQFLTHFRVNFTGVTKFQSGNGVVSIIREEEEQSNLVSKMGNGKEQSILFANHKTYYTHQILNLKPNTQYTINIEPIFSADSNKIGDFNQTICTTFRELPGYLETLILSKINKTTNLIELLLPKPNTENGTIDDYYINIKIIKEKTKRKRSVNFMDEKSMEELKFNSSYDRTESSNPYIAISLKHDEIFPLAKPLKHVHKIIIGEGTNNGQFKNWQLNTKFNYQFQLIACIGLKELQSLKFRCRASSWTNQINIIHTIPLSGKTTNLSVDNNIPYKSTRKGPSTFTTTTVVVILGIVILAILSMSIFLFIKRRKLSKSKLGAVYVTHSNRISNEKSICMEHLLKEPLVDSSVRISTSGSLRFKNPGNAYLEINNIQLSSTPDLLVRSSVPQPLSSLVQFHGQHFTNKYSEYAPIPVEVLPEHVAMLKENDGRLFNKEYESIEPGQQFTWNCSNMDINRPKNRYANVIAYDHSRVILQPLCEQKSTNFNESTIVLGSDYINANFISGYLNPKAYIATQGPLAESIGDFWRMMWEQNSSVIVMMTRLEERDRTKCDQYWPLGGKGSIATYSYINVTIVDIIELAYYTIRKFHIQKLNDSGLREVFQFQFTAWPDHGVPNHPAPLLMFLRRVHSEISRNCGPIVVHCSAGVGRTGAFIVIDYMLERLRYENTVDIYNYVTKIRSQRNYMVQTEDQYIFIYETLLEAVQCGNTEVPVSELAHHIEKLNQIEISHKTADGIQMTGLQMEFENLVLSSEGFLQGIKLNANNHSHCSTPSTTHGNIVTNYQPLTYETATLMVNQMKNRIIQILPPDFSRVNICPIRGVEGSDYINASWIDGYKSRKAYIAAQSPLSDTCEDFWRTLWEHNSSIIVMLTQLKENNRERCFQYWPCKRSSRYQFFIVDPVAEYNMTTYVIREFKLTDTRDSQSRVIRQFQFTDWQESESIPHSTQVFLDLINQVHKTKVQLGQDGPITVHCSAGSGRTGIFLALSNIIERMKNESVIDLFQTVKLLRWQRPALLQTEDQYQFCYIAALEYLKIFEQMRFDL